MGYSGDPNLGWTVKSSRQYVPENTSVGQLFTSGQLPDEDEQLANGINPDVWENNGTLTVVGSLTPAAPVVTAATATRVGERTVIADVTISSGGMPPAGVTYDWGDGSTPTERLHPPYAAGHKYAQTSTAYTITATTKNQTGTDTDTVQVTVPALPVLTSVTPLTGAAAGGTDLTFTGTGFQGGGLAIKIGGTAVTNVTVVSDTSVTCKSPAKAAGSYPVTLATNGGFAVNQPTYVYTA